jgi:YidC/Oxa1 family membrane protein insertase
MIDLHVFQLKRSINPVHYIYLFHAMGSTHMVDYENSYDHYDTIFCVGPHQINEIRRREEMAHLKKKNLFEHGYARVEQLIDLNKNSKADLNTGRANILIAPTWGENSILHICGNELVGALLGAGYKVVLRPHYQTILLAPQKVDVILHSYGSHENFSYIDKMGDTDSLLKSDLLICDWSSTSIEYALGLTKPVLYIDVPRRVRNQRYQDMGIEPFEVTIRQEAGAVLDPQRINDAPAVVEKLLANKETIGQHLVEIRDKLVFNLGRSAIAGAEEILRIAETSKK